LRRLFYMGFGGTWRVDGFMNGHQISL
jgi:hypothetical protein